VTRETTPSPPVTKTLGRSVEGRPIDAHLLGDGPLVVLFLATIHGDEAAGTPLLERLHERLRAESRLLAGRRAVIVPVANPDGLARGTRANARGVDLNRNFPSPNFRAGSSGGRTALSEPESRALHALLTEHRPARIVSLHQPLACVDWDGPGEELARRLAAACRLPARRLGSRPGSLGSWAGITLGLPIVTLELPARAPASPDALWERYGPALMVALSH
jgi:protein MpaA